ncbi:diaminopimelate decarboxylase [Candidatus Altiarchaeota archaeon]
MDSNTLTKAAEDYGTPVYVYDGDQIVARCREFKEAFHGFPAKVKFCYAVKANTNLTILRLIQRQGFGADIVSQGELDAALKAGFAKDDVIYTSNSKNMQDIKAAVEAGIRITCGNMHEIGSVKKAGGTQIAFRVNPDVSANTHPKISTALRASKFGLHFEDDIALEAVKKALELGLKVSGIHCHIGSNIKDTSAFTEAARKMLDFAVKIKELGVELEFIDFGGGLGIRYKDEDVVSASQFADSYRRILDDGIERLGYAPDVWFEPGRYIIGESGVLLTRVNSIKNTPEKAFINTDAGFNDLIRPAMYDAYHEIRVVGNEGDETCYDVAGNLCESGDILGRDRMLPATEAGDLIALMNAGAYGYSMASNYNSMPLPAEVLVRDGRIDLIRERQDIQELYVRQKIPKDLL